MIVRSPVALHVGFTPLRGGGYPGSQLGVFAAIRQMFEDARRYRELNELYERNPRGMRRPDLDRSMQALQPALARSMPVVMFADRQREIERALDLAQGVQPPRHHLRRRRGVEGGGASGGGESSRPRLAQLPAPRGGPAPDADPDPMRVLRDRVDAPKNARPSRRRRRPLRLPVGGLANTADILTNVSRAVEAGLARDEALRALTVRAAELFGVEKQTRDD